MFFWGCDVQHSAGNLLVRRGMERVARESAKGEGTSRYRIAHCDGVVELHGFCAGWYPENSAGMGAIFIRERERVGAVRGGCPLTPGRYESERLVAESPDALLGICRPLLEWVAEYERWVRHECSAEYRDECWRRTRSLPARRRWLAPESGLAWLESFLQNPAAARRARA
jgi:hypothetical protein